MSLYVGVIMRRKEGESRSDLENERRTNALRVRRKSLTATSRTTPSHIHSFKLIFHLR